MSEPLLNSVWLHLKTEGLYEILHVVTHTETMERLVVYRNIEDLEMPVWTRPLDMFMDGRFVMVQDYRSFPASKLRELAIKKGLLRTVSLPGSSDNRKVKNHVPKTTKATKRKRKWWEAR